MRCMFIGMYSARHVVGRRVGWHTLKADTGVVQVMSRLATQVESYAMGSNTP
jgi:hypothetical protein